MGRKKRGGKKSKGRDISSMGGRGDSGIFKEGIDGKKMEQGG